MIPASNTSIVGEPNWEPLERCLLQRVRGLHVHGPCRERSNFISIASRGDTSTSARRLAELLSLSGREVHRDRSVGGARSCTPLKYQRRGTTMAKGINKAFLLGHVGKDPDIRSTAGGTSSPLSLATSDQQKDGRATGGQDGVAQPRRLQPHRRDRPRYVKKGTQLFIEGKSRLVPGMTRNPAKKSIVRKSWPNELTLLGAAKAARPVVPATEAVEIIRAATRVALDSRGPRPAKSTPVPTRELLTTTFRSEVHLSGPRTGALRSAYFFEEIERWQPKKRT